MKKKNCLLFLFLSLRIYCKDFLPFIWILFEGKYASKFSERNSAVNKSAGLIINSRSNTFSDSTNTSKLDSFILGKVFAFSDIKATNITEECLL